MTAITFEKKKIKHADDKSSMVHIVHIDRDHLKFEDLHPQNSYVRQQDIARLHFARAILRGEANPHILTWTAMQTDRRVNHLFPNLNYTTDDGEELISSNSFITYVLRKLLSEGWLHLHEYVSDTYEWQIKIPPQHKIWETRARAINTWLEESIRLDLYPNVEQGTYQTRDFKSFDTYHNFVRIGRCDFIRNFVQSLERQAVFNTSHFLHEHDDLVSYHSGYGDALGLMAIDGTIFRPPLYQRSAIFFDGKSWQIDSLSMNDISIIIPDDIKLSSHDSATYRFEINPKDSRPIAVYTRAGRILDDNLPLDRTPFEQSRTELVIVNRQVVSWKIGGGLRIPQNGFVLSFQHNAIPQNIIDTTLGDAWVEFQFNENRNNIKHAVQAGPRLIKDGKSVVETSFRTEEFWASRNLNNKHVVGISPVNMNLSADIGRKARTGLGVKSDGHLVLVMIDGCDQGYETEDDSAGATLQELAQILQASGAIDAMNLSGEGSSQLFIHGGLFNTPSERRGHSGIVYERMIPSIAVVK